jgi:hypothetical protein
MGEPGQRSIGERENPWRKEEEAERGAALAARRRFGCERREGR